MQEICVRENAICKPIKSRPMGGRSQSGRWSSDEEYEVHTRVWSCITWKARGPTAVCQVENSYCKKQWKDSACSSTRHWLYWQNQTMKSPVPWQLPAHSYGSGLCPQVSLYEHLEDCAVHQALGVVLLNNYHLPKKCGFNPAYFSDRVQHAVLPTAASAQRRRQAALREQKQRAVG